MKTQPFLACFTVLCVTLTPLTGAVMNLAGFHEFGLNQVPGLNIKFGADEGLLAGAAGTRVSFPSGDSSQGGSTDGFYGPDGANGGIATNQVQFDTTNYLFEDDPGGSARLDPSFQGTNPSQQGTRMNGRVLDINGTDIFVENNTQNTFPLGIFYFDAFLGDTSGTNPSLVFNPFTIEIFGDSRNLSVQRSVSAGFAGHNSQNGEPVDTALSLQTGRFPVNNQIDFGFGTNYLDYEVDLTGLELRPGETVQVRFNAEGDNAVVRGDNFLLVTAIPEPSSSLLGLLGLVACATRRRR